MGTEDRQRREIANVDLPPSPVAPYALGAVLFHAPARRPPFEATNYNLLIVAIMTSAPPGIRSLRPEVPEDLAAVVDRALASDPAGRWPSAREMAAALAACRGVALESPAVEAVSAPTQPSDEERRGPADGRPAASGPAASERSGPTTDPPSRTGASPPWHEPVHPLSGPAPAEPDAVVVRPRRSRALVAASIAAIAIAVFAVVTVGAILWLGPPPRPAGPPGPPPLAPPGLEPPAAATVAAEPAGDADAGDGGTGADVREQAEAAVAEPQPRGPRGEPAAQEQRPADSRVKRGVLRVKARLERARWATCVGLCERTARQCQRQAGGPTASHLCIEQRMSCTEGCSR